MPSSGGPASERFFCLVCASSSAEAQTKEKAIHEHTRNPPAAQSTMPPKKGAKSCNRRQAQPARPTVGLTLAREMFRAAFSAAVNEESAARTPAPPPVPAGSRSRNPSTAAASGGTASKCKYGNLCTRPGCHYAHPSPSIKSKTKREAGDKAGKDCKFKAKCDKPQCPYAHPSPAGMKVRCEQCGDSFDTEKARDQHVKDKHKTLAKALFKQPANFEPRRPNELGKRKRPQEQGPPSLDAPFLPPTLWCRDVRQMLSSFRQMDDDARSVASVNPTAHAQHRQGGRDITDEDIQAAKICGTVSLIVMCKDADTDIDAQAAQACILQWARDIQREDEFRTIEFDDQLDNPKRDEEGRLRWELELRGSQGRGQELKRWLKSKDFFHSEVQWLINRVRFYHEGLVVIEGRVGEDEAGRTKDGVITVYPFAKAALLKQSVKPADSAAGAAEAGAADPQARAGQQLLSPSQFQQQVPSLVELKPSEQAGLAALRRRAAESDTAGAAGGSSSGGIFGSGGSGAASAGAADVAQVQELFPHVGERTAAALLASVDGNVERAVVALLEGGAASGLPEE